jgi:predicted phosphodiesterase
MTHRAWAPAVIAALVSCGDGKAPPKVRVETEAGVTAFSYSGQGCGYAVSPPETRAFEELALDDGGPGATPIRVRIGLGGGTTMGASGYADPSRTAVFTWETAEKNKAAKIRFGTSPDKLDQTRAGYTWTTPRPTIGFGTNEPETYMHEVHVCGLTPGTTYYYQVGAGDVWSATQSFTSVPETGPITVGISGDARDKRDVWILAQQRMKDAGVNLQLMSGDLVDIGGIQSLYQSWLDGIWKDGNNFITLGQQMMVLIAGNHENEAARFYGNFAIPGEGPFAEQYASFNVGNTHFVMIDDQPITTQETSEAAAAILKWMDEDLGRANADRAKHPFVVVINHRGIYTTSLHAADQDVLAARRLMAPIFDKHKVDLVINGHDHEFERSKPLRVGNPPQGAPVVQPPGQGTVYVVNAGTGADPYRVTVPVADFREVQSTYGGSTPYIGCYGIMTLEGTKLTLKSYMLKAGGGGVAGDELVDTFELTR